MDTINLLVTVDANYLRHVATMLASLKLNGGCENYTVYLVHSDINDADIDELDAYCGRLRIQLIPVRLHDDDFADAPVTAYYSKAMYYRLLACKLLPDTLDKVLYLDPDLLIINPIDKLYETDMGSMLFAAAAHTGLTDISRHINRIRLGTPESKGYFNSGVMLLNLKAQRERIEEQKIFHYVRTNQDSLILPDQDVLNALYHDAIQPLDDSIYNYDSRRYETYYLTSGGDKDINWVMENTAIIHYCGKEKPWQKSASGRFVPLYKHYIQIAKRL